MSITASRRLFSHLFTKNKKIECFISLRFKTDNHLEKKEPNLKHSDKVEIAVLKKFSEPLNIEKVSLPKALHSGEILIDVNYCALNGLDVLLSENLYDYEHTLPFVPGYEVSGTIIEASKDAQEKGYCPGNKVVALNKKKFGGLAEQCIVHADDVWKIPSSIKLMEAVCLMQNYMTALIGLEKYGSISEEDMILINVGIGGMGLAAVDICANVFRAKVIGVGFSEDRADKIRERGAYHAFTYKEKKLINEIKEIASERDIKDIFDDDSGRQFKNVLNSFMNVYKSKTPSKHLLRDDNFGVVVQYLSREGKIVIAGVADMNNEKDDEKSFTVKGINLSNCKKKKFELYRQTGDDVISFLEEELIKPAPSMVAGFYEVNKAMKFLSDMKACGKVVIDMKNKKKEAKIK